MEIGVCSLLRLQLLFSSVSYWHFLGLFADEFVVEKISDVDTVLAKTDDMEIPLGIRLDRIHNVYIAMGTLVTAIVIVITIVSKYNLRQRGESEILFKYAEWSGGNTYFWLFTST